MALSNAITGIVNLITFLLSIPLIGAGIWLATNHHSQCVKVFQWPLLLIGLIIFFVSLAGFVGAFWRISWLLYIYLLLMFFIILLLLAFIIFAFVVTKNGPPSDSSTRNFRLQDYSAWLQNQVQNGDNWSKIKSCIKDSNACGSLTNGYTSYAAFVSASLSPVQAGCCNPPLVCGYTFVNPTLWINPTNPNADTDCGTWSQDQTQLCYDCNSCKAGVVADVKQQWRKVAVVSVVVLVALAIVYIIGCCAFRNAQTEDLFKRYEEGYTSRSWRRRNWFRNE